MQRLPTVNAAAAAVMQDPQDASDDRDQPLYVNAKQYHRILKRRQARARLEASGKIPKERRVSSVNKLPSCSAERLNTSVNYQT